jgi:hypothetical protein
VPDSLISKLSIDTAQLHSGVCSIETFVELVSNIEDGYYTSWHLSSPRTAYRQVGGIPPASQYSLAAEVDSLNKGKKYSTTGWIKGGNIYRDTTDAIMTVIWKDLEKRFPSVPYIRKNFKVGDNWIRDLFMDTVASKPITQTMANVISEVSVTVPAGTYMAFKIQLTTYHYNPDYSFDEGFEYWVPNVGLVLKESDMQLSQWNSSTGLTISFRQITRQELTSANFLY